MTQEMEGCGKAELSPDLNPCWIDVQRTEAGTEASFNVKKYILMQVSVYGNENWVNVIQKTQFIHIMT